MLLTRQVNAFLKSESIVLVPDKLSSFYNFHTVEDDPFRYQGMSFPASSSTDA